MGRNGPKNSNSLSLSCVSADQDMSWSGQVFANDSVLGSETEFTRFSSQLKGEGDLIPVGKMQSISIALGTAGISIPKMCWLSCSAVLFSPVSLRCPLGAAQRRFCSRPLFTPPDWNKSPPQRTSRSALSCSGWQVDDMCSRSTS